MAITKEVTTNLTAKATQAIVYLGSIDENLSLSDASVRLSYTAMLNDYEIKSAKDGDGNVINPEVIVSVADLEAQFPGVVATLTQIADHYNPYQ